MNPLRKASDKPRFKTRETVFGLVEDRFAILKTVKDWLSADEESRLCSPPPYADCVIVERTDGVVALRFVQTLR